MGSSRPDELDILTTEKLNVTLLREVRLLREHGDDPQELLSDPNGLLRSGVTANINIPLQAQPAHRVPTTILALNSEGELGVRIVENDAVVRFVPVILLSDDGEEVWVAGLPEPANVIVLGQEFVAEGTRVRSRLEN